jgi:hypothetical protein
VPRGGSSAADDFVARLANPHATGIGRPIENALDLKIALSRIPLGSSIGVQIYRAGVRLDATVTIRERTLQ